MATKLPHSHHRHSPGPPPPPPLGGTVSLKDFDINNNNLIDDGEFFDIIDAWIATQIDDSLFFQALDLWVSQAQISSANVNAKLLRLEGTALASDGEHHAMMFIARGQGITALHVDIFTLAGTRIFSAEKRDQEADRL